MKSTNHTSNPIAPKEIVELKRVYNQLCFFADKVQALERLNEIRDTLDECHCPLTTSTLQRELHSISEESNEEVKKMLELQEEEQNLQKTLSEIHGRPNQHIRSQDTAAALRALGKKVTKKEIEDMMWEVDEKVDGVIDWEEFQLNFERNIRDKSGLEPASFYHMVQFMIYDRDNNGLVSIDETMNMLYARVGRDEMEVMITKLFGGDDGAPIKEVGQQGGEIDFKRYWDVVVREHRKKFDESDLGKVLVEKKQRNKK